MCLMGFKVGGDFQFAGGSYQNINSQLNVLHMFLQLVNENRYTR